MLAGQTYICDDDIPGILQSKCIDVKYQGITDDEILNQNICGRDLIDFLNGKGIRVPSSKSPLGDALEPSKSQMLEVLTGNDLEMINA